MKPETVHATLDARGLACPMPVVRAAKSIQTIATGEVLEVLATDKGACHDIPAWCRSRNYDLIHNDQVDDCFRFYIRKG